MIKKLCSVFNAIYSIFLNIISQNQAVFWILPILSIGIGYFKYENFYKLFSIDINFLGLPIYSIAKESVFITINIILMGTIILTFNKANNKEEQKKYQYWINLAGTLALFQLIFFMYSSKFDVSISNAPFSYLTIVNSFIVFLLSSISTLGIGFGTVYNKDVVKYLGKASFICIIFILIFSLCFTNRGYLRDKYKNYTMIKFENVDNLNSKYVLIHQTNNHFYIVEKEIYLNTLEENFYSNQSVCEEVYIMPFNEVGKATMYSPSKK